MSNRSVVPNSILQAPISKHAASALKRYPYFICSSVFICSFRPSSFILSSMAITRSQSCQTFGSALKIPQSLRSVFHLFTRWAWRSIDGALVNLELRGPNGKQISASLANEFRQMSELGLQVHRPALFSFKLALQRLLFLWTNLIHLTTSTISPKS